MSVSLHDGREPQGPTARSFLAPKDISLIVVGVNLGRALCWSKPAVSDGANDNSPGTEPESDGSCSP